MMTKQIGYKQKYRGGENSPSNYAIHKTQDYALETKNWNDAQLLKPIKTNIENTKIALDTKNTKKICLLLLDTNLK